MIDSLLVFFAHGRPIAITFKLMLKHSGARDHWAITISFCFNVALNQVE